MTPIARGGSFLRFRTGTTGASGRHVAYITRERAVVDRQQAVRLYQLPEHVRAASDYEELRQTLIAYADTREEIELAQHTARGKPRTHYRVLASFERDVSNEKALGMVKEWLDREFPRSRALAVVRRDTEQTHVHVWIDARQIDGRKIQPGVSSTEVSTSPGTTSTAARWVWTRVSTRERKRRRGRRSGRHGSVGRSPSSLSGCEGMLAS